MGSHIIKSVIKSVLPARVRDDAKKKLIEVILGHDFPGFSFAAGGEDTILNYLFGFKNTGFFVDVGAFHPVKFSNTYLFYLKGWRGINIDASPGSMSAFRQLRPEDINLELAISDKQEELTYYVMREGNSTMNTFSMDFVHRLNMEQAITQEIKVQPRALSKVFEEHLPPARKIDFLTIDVEGLELSVLASNDWQKYRPKVIMLEDFDALSSSLFEAETVRTLAAAGYRPILKTTTEIVFLEQGYQLSPTGQVAPKDA